MFKGVRIIRRIIVNQQKTVMTVVVGMSALIQGVMMMVFVKMEKKCGMVTCVNVLQ